MKRGFLLNRAVEHRSVGTSSSSKECPEASSTRKLFVSCLNMPADSYTESYTFSAYARTHSTNPHIVNGDHRLPSSSSPHLLYHPSQSQSMVLVDSLENTIQFSKWMSQRPDPPALPETFIIRDCGAKGVGAFARRALQRRELVMRERPVYVSQPSARTAIIADHTRAFYESVLAGLSASAQASILSMRNAVAQSAEGVDPILGRIHTNALAAKMPAPLDEAAHYPALFPTLCRLNHACVPNTHYTFDTGTFTGRLAAVRPIAVGEELTLGYVDLAAPRAQRRALLKERYFFECACASCSLSGEDLAATTDATVTLDKAETLIRDAKAEGLVEATSILVVSALRLARKEGDNAKWLRLTVEAVNYVRMLEGLDAEAFRTMAQRMRLTTGELAEMLDKGEAETYQRLAAFLAGRVSSR